ncbi:GD10749 [Drosophila simulans]|uniref:GD10749 n=1 Tax=Drosophila simulans TaxID=7240 RepID=B4QAL8_DROSI|nr:GD10749 [Drosophila simulans]
MKAAIVLALIGTVLTAPPVRVMPKPGSELDQYAHIFAKVRPPGQKHQNMEIESQPQHHNYLSSNHVNAEINHVEPKQPQFMEHGSSQVESRPPHTVDFEIKPVEQKPPQRLEFEVKPQHEQNSPQGHLVSLGVKPVEQKPPQHLEVEIKQQQPHSSPNHQVELEIKQVEQKPPQHLEIEIKPVDQKPPHRVELEIQQQHHQSSAQGHLVSLGAVEHKPQHIDHELNNSQKIELEFV